MGEPAHAELSPAGALVVFFARCAAVLAPLLAAWAVAAEPEPAPVPPCGSGPLPAYAPVGQVPVPRVWRHLDWQPPACLGAWPDSFRFVIAVSGRIGKAHARELLARLGAVSGNKGVRYFSVTENAWRELIRDASALSDAIASHRRADFTADEVASGAPLYFVEEDNRSSEPVVYRMRALLASPDRIIVETANVTPISAMLVTLFPPESLVAAYMLSRLEGGEWGLYAISASTPQASGMVSLATASYINRAQALYGHLAGIVPAVTAPSN
jgi:uncharacterized protein DUF6675